MHKSGAIALFDAVDEEPTGRSTVDLLVWLGCQVVSLASALALFLERNGSDRRVAGGSHVSDAPVAKLALFIQNALQGQDVVLVATSIAFVLSTAVIVILQAEHRYLARLGGAGLAVGFLYTLVTARSVNGWAYNSPLFVWTGLVLSSFAQWAVRGKEKKHEQAAQPPHRHSGPKH